MKTQGKSSTLQLRYAKLRGMTKKILNRYEQSRSLASYNGTKGEGDNKRIFLFVCTFVTNLNGHIDCETFLNSLRGYHNDQYEFSTSTYNKLLLSVLNKNLFYKLKDKRCYNYNWT